MFTIPNQSSIPKAYTQFTDDLTGESEHIDPEGGSRLMPSGNRDRLVDCMEEFVKYTIVMRPHFDLFGDRYSERIENMAKQQGHKRQDLHSSAAAELASKKTKDQIGGVNVSSI